MTEYRKKPVVIDAWEYKGPDTHVDINDVWVIEAFISGELSGIQIGDEWYLEVRTLEDGPNGEAQHVASVGDYIIRGVQGELYPCKPDIFWMTHEHAD